jgi:hypothetical protein
MFLIAGAGCTGHASEGLEFLLANLDRQLLRAL